MEWLLATAAVIAVAIWAGRRLDRRPPADVDPVHAGGAGPPCANAPSGDAAVELYDEIDLHGVAASDIDVLVDEFVTTACQQGQRCVTIVHGRGTGILRRRVRARLARHPGVERYADATGRARGATAVWLVPLAEDASPD
jgi:DNA mismatch repair protein MutS2